VILSGSAQVQSIAGKPVTQSILRDVTEQRLAERRLDESQRNLEALVENTGDSIWSVDREHRLITLNSAFSLAIEARTGREPQVGEFPADVFASEDVEWYERLYAKTLAGERHSDRRTDHVDGQLRSFEVFANPIQSVDGVSGAVFFGKDVTGRVRAEEALRVAKDEAEAANKAKSDFLANMSHELRTPLNSVIGFTNILLKNKEDRLTDKDMGFLQRVLTNGKHLLALINEVLDLAKVEAGRMELIIEDVDLAHLCVETVQQLEGQARSKGSGVVLRADVPDSVNHVETDSAKLKQVIINLVGNALKFTHDGSVTVRLEMGPDGRTPTAIAVQDTGIGIPADRLEAIFEAFQQAEAGTSRKYGGTGLGLALSRSICLLMGYDLIVESKFGEGSTFRIVMGARAERPVLDDQDDTPEALAPAGEGPSRANGSHVSTQGTTDAARWGAGGGALDELPLTLVPLEDSRSLRTVRNGSPGAGASTGHVADAVEVGSRDRSAAGDQQRPTWNDFKVLVVDDERDSRVLAAHFLEDFGCQVFTASGGEEGLELARRIRPDLMTLDLIMPGVSGWEVLRRMKADPELRGVPVVVLSVVANEGRGRLLGAVDLVTKPFDREDLLRVLWRNLGRRRGGRVLLMVADEERRTLLSRVVRERGLEVAAGDSGDLMATLAREAPDAVVLDLADPRTNMLAELLHLRDDRVQTGLPVLVMTHPELNDQERTIVTELATVHAPATDSARALERLLDASFPLAGAPG
jgi:PAS domain S-box-containing protein